MKIYYTNRQNSVDRQIIVKESKEQTVSKEASVFYTSYPAAEALSSLKEFFSKEGKNGKENLEIRLDLPDLSENQIKKIVDIIILSLYEGAYTFHKECLKEWNAQEIYKKRDSMTDYGDRAFTFVSDIDLNETIKESQKAALCIGYARTLGNLPYNFLQIPDMIRYTEEMAADRGMKCTVLREQELKELGCGGILAVNQGSTNEAAMIVLEWCKNKEKEKKALVGKGIMFDAGGYNLKGMAEMRGMKFDMCGAANALECMEIAAWSNYDENFICAIALAENLIGPEAVKMGDVIHTLSGKTVEVLNTDAEGRLILCDALTYVQNMGASKVVDLATLTNGCKSALGNETVGIFSNDEAFYEAFSNAMKHSGERFWRLPFGDIYEKELCYSDTADFANYSQPGCDASASIAASFLNFFIEPETKWIHLDFVGPSVAKNDSEQRVKGATGVCMASVREWLKKQ